MDRINYKVKRIRMSEETWDNLRKRKVKSGMSWNLFLLGLIKKNGEKK